MGRKLLSGNSKTDISVLFKLMRKSVDIFYKDIIYYVEFCTIYQDSSEMIKKCGFRTYSINHAS